MSGAIPPSGSDSGKVDPSLGSRVDSESDRGLMGVAKRVVSVALSVLESINPQDPYTDEDRDLAGTSWFPGWVDDASDKILHGEVSSVDDDPPLPAVPPKKYYLWSRTEMGEVISYSLTPEQESRHRQALESLQLQLKTEKILPDGYTNFNIVNLKERQATYKIDGVTHELDLREFCLNHPEFEKQIGDLIDVLAEAKQNHIILNMRREKSKLSIAVVSVDLAAKTFTYNRDGITHTESLDGQTKVFLEEARESIKDLKKLDKKSLETPSLLLRSPMEGSHTSVIKKGSEKLSKVDTPPDRTWAQFLKGQPAPLPPDPKTKSFHESYEKAIHAREKDLASNQEAVQTKLGEIVKIHTDDEVLAQLKRLKDSDSAKYDILVVDPSPTDPLDKEIQKQQISWCKQQLLNAYKEESAFLEDVSKMRIHAAQLDKIMGDKGSFLLNVRAYPEVAVFQTAATNASKESDITEQTKKFSEAMKAGMDALQAHYDEAAKNDPESQKMDPKIREQLRDQHLLDCMMFLVPKEAEALFNEYAVEYVKSHEGTCIRSQSVQALASFYRHLGDKVDSPDVASIRKKADIEVKVDSKALDQLKQLSNNPIHQKRSEELSKVHKAIQALSSLAPKIPKSSLRTTSEEKKLIEAIKDLQSSYGALSEPLEYDSGGNVKIKERPEEEMNAYDDLLGKIRDCEAKINFETELREDRTTTIPPRSTYALRDLYSEKLKELGAVPEKVSKSGQSGFQVQVDLKRADLRR